MTGSKPSAPVPAWAALARADDRPDRVTSGGRVTLVGAGPGGADLITVRGAVALGRADVVVYDRLADPDLLDLAPADAERIAVGKRKGAGACQDAINALLVDRARRGRHVVRLKGGDPFVFGRGSEEVDHCRAAGIPVEVVPGLTSAIAAPALAGIPVTERGQAAAVMILSGHRIPHAADDWPAIPDRDTTLVVLMAASNSAAVARRLLGQGRAADEPVAVVHRAGLPGASTAATTLGGLADGAVSVASPSVLVIGGVAERASRVSP